MTSVEDGSEVLEVEEGDVIDVEEEEDDNPNDVFPYELGYFKQRLREKPQFESEPVNCGTTCPKKSYQDFSLPSEDRLSLLPLPLDFYKKLTPVPRGCTPPLSLPSWHYLPLEKKIPMPNHYPKDLFYYTRGKLAENLYRKPADFDLRDPNLRERIIRGPYNSLHDPHSKNVFEIPGIRDILYKQGMINEFDEVICNLAEFNRYRDYLRVQYCSQISKQLEDSDTMFRYEREQVRMLLREENQSGEKAARAEAAKRFHDEIEEYKKQKMRQKEQLVEARLRQWRNEKHRKLLARIVENGGRRRNLMEMLANRRLQRQRSVIANTCRKLMENEERRRSDKLIMQDAYDKFLLEWIESKYVYCYEKLAQRKQMRADLQGALKYNAKQRLTRLERYRTEFPHLLEKKKAEEERLWGVVRKFAMRWLGKIRARLNAPKDVKHESCWIGGSKHLLEDTVKYLRQESGYEKLDDFILNILKLKKQIQHQIEMEEAEEAAKEGEEEEGSEGEYEEGTEE